MKLIQLFDIKTRTLGFAFCQPQKKSSAKSLTQKKSLQNFKPKKSPQIANFKPKKGLRTSPSLIYLSTPPGLWVRHVQIKFWTLWKIQSFILHYGYLVIALGDNGNYHKSYSKTTKNPNLDIPRNTYTDSLIDTLKKTYKIQILHASVDIVIQV